MNQPFMGAQSAAAIVYAFALVLLVAGRRVRRSGHRGRFPSNRPPTVRRPSPAVHPVLERGRHLTPVSARSAAAVVAGLTLSAVAGVLLVLETSQVAKADAANRTIWNKVSTSRYTLSGSDGSAWVEMDGTNLAVTLTPFAQSTAVLSASADLFTTVAGYNQDLAICVAAGTSITSGCANGNIVIWKEAGGYTAAKPAQVFAQVTQTMSEGTTYTVALFWKTNQKQTSGSISAGAGPSSCATTSTCSPTTLSVVLTPTSESIVQASTGGTATQYSTTSTSWALMDGTNLVRTFTPSSSGSALLTANADVFTTTSGTNQDLGICWVQGSSIAAGCSNGTILGWAENGGAAAYMPIAALVEASHAVTGGTTYSTAIVWRAGTSAGIRAGAGATAPFSMSTLTVQMSAAADNQIWSAAVTSQPARAYSSGDNGTSWSDMSTTGLALSITPAVTEEAYLGANASLFANSANYNIDLGICVQAGGGSCNNVGWTESGSGAAYSPDASFLQVPYLLSANTTYTIKMQWRTNVALSSGNALFAGAGGSSPFSPTALTAILVPDMPPTAPTNVVGSPVSTPDSDGKVVVSWTAPSSSPGSPITQYTVIPYDGSTALPAVAVTDHNAVGVVRSAGVSGLTKGKPYTFHVNATNSMGTGPDGVSAAVVPEPPPTYSVAGGGGSSPVVTSRGSFYASASGSPEQVVLADATGHSVFPDVITANNSGNSLSTLKNVITGAGQAGGHFTGSAVVSATGAAAPHVATGNLSGHTDGAVDAVVVNNTSTIFVFRGDGAGSFAPFPTPTYTLLDGTAERVTVADVNGDGKLDIVVAGVWSVYTSPTEIAVLMGHGDGSFSPPVELNDGYSQSEPSDVQVADVNGDGQPDILEVVWSGGAGDSGELLVRLNVGAGSFAAATVAGGSTRNLPGPESNAGNTLVVGHFTGRAGILDAAVLTSQAACGLGAPACPRGIQILVGNGDGTFKAPVYIHDPALVDAAQQNDFGSVKSIGVADMNGDGVQDIVTADEVNNSPTDGVSVYLGVGTASGLDSPVFLPTGAFIPEGLAVGDVNGDGLPDIVVDRASTGVNVEVLINGTDLPPLGGPLGPNEMHGCVMCQALAGGGTLAVSGDPITANSGEFSEAITDLSIPARGYPLAVTQTYNDLNATVDSGLGDGWWSPLFMSLAQNGSTGITTVTEENGGQAQFFTSTLQPVAPRIQATLSYDSGTSTWTFKRYAGSTFTFNSSGQIVSLADRTGDSLTYGYTSGHVTSVTHSDGRSLSIAWTGSHISSITDSNGPRTRTVAFTYQTAGDGSTQLTDIDSKVDTGDLNEHFEYSSSTWADALTGMRDPRGVWTTMVYDSSGHTTSQAVDPTAKNPSGLNRVTSYAYTVSGGQVTQVLITDPMQRQEIDTFAYGELVEKQTGLTGCPTACSPSSPVTWTYAFDPSSLGTTTSIDPDGNVISAKYDSYGNPLVRTDGLGRSTSFAYSGNGGADAQNYQPTTMTDGNGVTTTYSYDTTYRTLTQTSTPLGTTGQSQVVQYQHGNSSHPGDVTAMVDPDGKTWSYGYDADGNRVESKDPLANVSASVYNGDGWVTQAYTPKAGCTWASTPPTGCSSTYETQYSYVDASNVTDFRGDWTRITDPLGHTQSRVYDANANVTQATDGDGNATGFTYDDANEPTVTTRADAGHTTLVTDYNADGQVIDEKDGKGNAIVSNSYNALGEVVATQDGVQAGNTCTLGGSNQPCTQYTYDGNGNVLTRLDPSVGNNCAGPLAGCTVYTYDGANELSTVSYVNSSENVSSIVYDGDGQRTGMTDGTGSSSWTYDSLHRLTAYTNGHGATVSYGYSYGAGPTYDLKNQVRSIVYPGSVGTVTQDWYDNGLLHTVTDWNSKSVAFGYDANSNQTSQTDPSTTNVVDTFGFDAADQMTSVTDGNGSTLFSATYGRDGNGQVTTDSSQASNQQAYRYTPLNQLCYAGSSNTNACSSPPASSYPYAFDAADNLTTNNGSTQQFNAADELCWTVTGTSSNACGTVPSGATTYTYDARGNRTHVAPSSGAQTCDAFDQDNRLLTIQTGTGSSCSTPTTVATYTYDGDALRESKVVGSTTTQFTWSGDSGSELLQQSAGGTTTCFLYGPGQLPVEEISGSTVTYLNHDQIGSTRLLTDAAGASGTATTITYDPYGNQVSGIGSLDAPLRFTGQYRDAETGAYYLRARYYDSATAQFLSRDPAAAVTREPYGYTGGNPLYDVDPSGLGAMAGCANDLSPTTSCFPGYQVVQGAAVLIGLLGSVIAAAASQGPDESSASPATAPATSTPAFYGPCPLLGHGPDAAIPIINLAKNEPAQLSPDEQAAVDARKAGEPVADVAAYNRAMQKIRQAQKYAKERNAQKRKSS